MLPCSKVHFKSLWWLHCNSRFTMLRRHEQSHKCKTHALAKHTRIHTKHTKHKCAHANTHAHIQQQSHARTQNTRAHLQSTRACTHYTRAHMQKILAQMQRHAHACKSHGKACKKNTRMHAKHAKHTRAHTKHTRTHAKHAQIRRSGGGGGHPNAMSSLGEPAWKVMMQAPGDCCRACNPPQMRNETSAARLTV